MVTTVTPICSQSRRYLLSHGSSKKWIGSCPCKIQRCKCTPPPRFSLQRLWSRLTWQAPGNALASQRFLYTRRQRITLAATCVSATTTPMELILQATYNRIQGPSPSIPKRFMARTCPRAWAPSFSPSTKPPHSASSLSRTLPNAPMAKTTISSTQGNPFLLAPPRPPPLTRGFFPRSPQA